MAKKNNRQIIIAIGDNHLPFLAKPVWTWILESIIGPFADDILAIVDMGDKYDFASFSRFPKRMSITPADETSLAKKMATQMWADVQKIAPGAKCYQLKGNHDERLAKRVIEIMPEVEHLIDYKSLWTFDGVETVHDSHSPLVIGDWTFIHGHTHFGGHLKALDFSTNVVTGHTHTGGVINHRINHFDNPKILTELNCGFIGNPFNENLIYRPMGKFFKWTWGVGMIDPMGARFIPFQGKLK